MSFREGNSFGFNIKKRTDMDGPFISVILVYETWSIFDILLNVIDSPIGLGTLVAILTISQLYDHPLLLIKL